MFSVIDTLAGAVAAVNKDVDADNELAGELLLGQSQASTTVKAHVDDAGRPVAVHCADDREANVEQPEKAVGVAAPFRNPDTI